MDAVIGRFIGGRGVGRLLWPQPRSLASYTRCNPQRRVGHMQILLEPNRERYYEEAQVELYHFSLF